MVQIQFRRYGAGIPATENAALGEPFYDDAKRRLGVFPNVDASSVDWLPIVEGDKVYLNDGQTLSGKLSNGSDNGVELDFSVANKLTIKNKLTGTVYASFAEAGVGLHSPTPTTDIVEGMVNLTANGNLSVLDPFTPTTAIVSSGATRIYPIAPNFLVWKNPSGSGNIWTSIVTAITPHNQVKRSFKIVTAGAPNFHGLRSYVPMYSVADRPITVGGWYFGPVGATCTIRVSTDNGTVAQHTFSGTGGWNLEWFTTTVFSQNVDYVYIDYVYNPSTSISSGTTWYAAGLFTNRSREPKPYESLDSAITLGLLRGRYDTGSVFVTGSNWGSISVPFAAGVTPDLKTYSTSGNVSVTGLVNSGAAVSIPTNTAGTLARIDYSIHSLPRSIETV